MKSRFLRQNEPVWLKTLHHLIEALPFIKKKLSQWFLWEFSFLLNDFFIYLCRNVQTQKSFKKNYSTSKAHKNFLQPWIMWKQEEKWQKHNEMLTERKKKNFFLSTHNLQHIWEYHLTESIYVFPLPLNAEHVHKRNSFIIIHSSRNLIYNKNLSSWHKKKNSFLKENWKMLFQNPFGVVKWNIHKK